VFNGAFAKVPSNAPADASVVSERYQQEKVMKRMCLAALTGALAISTVAVAIDVASAAPRHGVYRGGVGRVGVGRVGVGRVGYGRVGYGRWAGYRPGYGLGYRRGYGWGAAAVAGAALGAGYYASGGYDAYASGGDDAYASGGDDAYASGDYSASGDYGASGGETYILHGATMSESEAIAYCARQFRSYDAQSQTFVAYSGERVSCPQ
jgi:hypothetical protein